MSTALSVHPDVELARYVAQFKYDPLGYCLVAFPWRKKGTQLENHDGPCPCQRKLLKALGDAMQERSFDGHTACKPIRIACSSGHGIGKSAFFGMVADWIRVCWPYSQGSATANTFTQLSTKTWANIKKWLSMSICAHWFVATTEKIYHPMDPDSWFLSTQSSSEENSEAFAGQHAQNSISYYINDECSGIPDKIFEVQEGGLTDGCPIQFAFGNPTKPTGKFARIMSGSERGWITIRIDSRECPFTNKDQIQEWIDEYGIDSDFIRVRVLGLPPRSATAQFISDDLIAEAQKRPLVGNFPDEPLIAGVDFAWGGEDNNVIRFRRGLDARSIQPIKIPGEFTRKPEVMVTKLAEVFTKDFGGGLKVAHMFMDSAGIAGPVAIRLRQLGFSNLTEVNFNAHSVNPKYKNVRAQMYGDTKDWLIGGGCIDKSPQLTEDLRAQEVAKHVPMLLVPKEILAKPEKLGRSPDESDSLVLTFYMPVKSKQVREFRKPASRRTVGASYMG